MLLAQSQHRLHHLTALQAKPTGYQILAWPRYPEAGFLQGMREWRAMVNRQDGVNHSLNSSATNPFLSNFLVRCWKGNWGMRSKTILNKSQ